jgi:CheY-like chemotaxis protein
MVTGIHDFLTGARILVVEDDHLQASDLAQSLADCGAVVVGPVPTVMEALSLIDGEHDHLRGAILDINLRGEAAYPVADALLTRGVPFIFATGYEAWSLPERYAGVPCC